MADQLERMGASLEEYLTAEDKTEEELDAELTDAAAEGVQVQLLLDTFADAEEIQVTDDEFGHEIVHRAQRAGVAAAAVLRPAGPQPARPALSTATCAAARRWPRCWSRSSIKDTDGDRAHASTTCGATRTTATTGHDHD